MFNPKKSGVSSLITDKNKMKNLSLFILLALLSTPNLLSQTPVPNGNLETWNSGSYSFPTHYNFSSALENASLFIENESPFNLSKTTGFHGLYGAKLTTVKVGIDTIFGYFINYQPSNDQPANWHGGTPYSETPTAIRGYYKYNLETEDSAMVITAFSKNGVNIGTYVNKIGGIKSDFTLFNFPLTPALSTTPDSVIVAFTSSDISKKTPFLGASVDVDSISFVGVANQPALMNGDLETWTDTTINKPSGWYTERMGTVRSTDSFSGSYAVELTTYLGDENQVTVARNASLSNGYYDNNCNNNCYPKGGIPFSNQIDTLALYYKYFPSGNDSASVSLRFKKNGVFTDQRGLFLKSSPSYKYVKLDFNLASEPDSVIIEIYSSDWNNKNISFVGSKLILDDIHFTATLPTKLVTIGETGVQIAVLKNEIALSGITSPTGVEMFNVAGVVVYKESITSPRKIDTSLLPQGIYIINLVCEDGSRISKKIIIVK